MNKLTQSQPEPRPAPQDQPVPQHTDRVMSPSQEIRICGWQDPIVLESFHVDFVTF